MMVMWDQMPSPPPAQAHASPGSPDFSSSGLFGEFDDPLRFNQTGGELDAWIDSVVRATPPKKVPTPACTTEETRRVTKSSSPTAQLTMAIIASEPPRSEDQEGRLQEATNKKEDSKSASTGTTVENFSSNPSTQLNTKQVHQPGDVVPGPLAMVSAGPWGTPAHPGSFGCGPPTFPPSAFPPSMQPPYFPPQGNPQLQGYPVNQPHMMMAWPAPPYGHGYVPAYGQPPPGMCMHWHAPVMTTQFAAAPGHPAPAEGTKEGGRCENCQNQHPPAPITPVPASDPANAEGPPEPAKPAVTFPQLPVQPKEPVCIPRLPVKGRVWKKTLRRKLTGRAKMLHDAKVERDRLAALQQAGQNSAVHESSVSGTAPHKVVNPGPMKQKSKSNEPVLKPAGEKKAPKETVQQTSKNASQPRKEKRLKENIPVKEVLKEYKNDRGRAIAKGLALKRQRDLASKASNASKPTKAALQMKLKEEQPVTPLNAHSVASAKSVVSISDLTGQLKPACTAKVSTSVLGSSERSPADNNTPEGTTAQCQATGRGSSIAEGPQLADDASESPPPDAEAHPQSKSEDDVEDPPGDDYLPKNGTITQACLIVLLEEAANGNSVVTKNHLYDGILMCPSLDAYYRGLLDDKNFWWKSFRWIQGMKYYTCPRRGSLTAELTQKGKDVAVLCYQEAMKAEILPPNSKIDDYIRQQ